MFSDEELKLAFAVVAAAAFMKGEAPGLTRVLCGRPACAEPGAGPGAEPGAGPAAASAGASGGGPGGAEGTAWPMAGQGNGDCGHPPAPGAEPRGPAPETPEWPTAAAADGTASIGAASIGAAADGAAADGPRSIGTAAGGARGEGGQTRLVLAVDIAGFTDARRDDEVQLALRRALYQLLAEAFEASGISWADCVHEDRGDGVVVVVPQVLPPVILVDPLLHRLRAALRRHNRMASEVARIGLRVAVHMGQVHRDEHGLAGTAVNHLFRLLDAHAVRTALAASGSELALIVSDHYYECVVRQRPSMIESAAFRPAAVNVKQARDHGWVWTPPLAVDAGRAVAVRWWMTPVGAVCTMLWGGGATLIAAAGVDPPPAAGLALGVVAVTGIVMAVTMALTVPATARSTRSGRAIWSDRPSRSSRSRTWPTRDPAPPPGTGSGGPDGHAEAAAAGVAGGALSGG
jgi:hypothetical protein